MRSDGSERIADLERKVGYLIRYLGLGPVGDALSRGKPIDAIKVYRTLTGASLADAKRAVDSMARDL